MTLKVRNWHFSIATCQTLVDLPKIFFYEKVLFFTQLIPHLMRKLLKHSSMVSTLYVQKNVGPELSIKKTIIHNKRDGYCISPDSINSNVTLEGQAKFFMPLHGKWTPASWPNRAWSIWGGCLTGLWGPTGWLYCREEALGKYV